MDKVLIYLVECSFILVILYSLYQLFLRKETLFTLNRYYLLGILLASHCLPLMSFETEQTGPQKISGPMEEIAKARRAYYDLLDDWSIGNHNVQITDRKTNETAPREEAGFDGIRLLLNTIMTLYFLGVLLCLSRTAWNLFRIARMVKLNEYQLYRGAKLVRVKGPLTPFSFLNFIFVSETSQDPRDLDQVIAHELTHVRQYHSIDLIIVQLFAAILWFNPVIWLLIKSLKTTHEYIADNKILKMGYSLVEYQSLLLRQLIGNNSLGLVHNFNLSFIKKRITMMTTKKSGWIGKFKVALTLLCTIAMSTFILQCNSTTDLESGTTALEDHQSTRIELPILPKTGYEAELEAGNTLSLVIANDQITFDGDEYKTSEIGALIQNSGLDERGVIVLSVDRSQQMSILADVQTALRKADRRKLLYVGSSGDGSQVVVPFLLPPSLDSEKGQSMPVIDDDYVSRNNLELMKIDLGQTPDHSTQSRVRDMVMEHVKMKSSNYVVSGHFEDDDAYGNYLVNLVHIQEGFNEIYRKRAEGMFGKDLYDLEKQEYNTVRKGIPRAISIAER